MLVMGATVHTGPGVSAPIVRYYPVGTKLQVDAQEQGWLHIVDPATSNEGWIYEIYFAAIGDVAAVPNKQMAAGLGDADIATKAPTRHLHRARHYVLNKYRYHQHYVARRRPLLRFVFARRF
jgi:uncharacterized protein YraI